MVGEAAALRRERGRGVRQRRRDVGQPGRRRGSRGRNLPGIALRLRTDLHRPLQARGRREEDAPLRHGGPNDRDGIHRVAARGKLDTRKREAKPEFDAWLTSIKPEDLNLDLGPVGKLV